MSKHKESKPRFADWEARIALGTDGLVQTQEFPGTRWKRDGHGFYTFRDDLGIVAEFAPGGVLSVRRQSPPVVVHPPGGLDAVAALGESLAARGGGVIKGAR